MEDPLFGTGIAEDVTPMAGRKWQGVTYAEDVGLRAARHKVIAEGSRPVSIRIICGGVGDQRGVSTEGTGNHHERKCNTTAGDLSGDQL